MVLKLRELTQADLQTLFEYQVEPEAQNMAAFSARPWDEFMAHWETKVLVDQSSLKKAIEYENALAGYVLSWNQDGKVWIGYWLGRQYWGKGIATRALTQFLESCGDSPLHAYVAKHNVGSIRVLEKCGFRKMSEGRIFSNVHGQEIDECLMARP